MAGGQCLQSCGEGGFAAQIPGGVLQKQPNKAGFAVFCLFAFPLKQALRACSQTKNPAIAGTLLGCFCGEGGIRTLGTV